MHNISVIHSLTVNKTKKAKTVRKTLTLISYIKCSYTLKGHNEILHWI